MPESGAAKLNRRQFASAIGLAATAAGPTAYPTAAQQGNAQLFPHPDLGNLFPFVEAVAQTKQPRLTFLENRWKDLDSWKREARPLFREALHYDPPPEALRGDVLSTVERDGLIIETVDISATSFYSIPAKLLRPANRKGKLPGIVALHDHSGRYVWGHEKVVSDKSDSKTVRDFRERAYGRPYAEELARRGFVVLTIDAFYFGSRRLQVEDLDVESASGRLREPLRRIREAERGAEEWLTAVNTACGAYEHLTAKTIFSAGATWPGILVWDDRRSIDYLVSRPEVDPSRIGSVGLSIGGFRSALLAGADPRIQVACVTGWMTEFRHQLRNHLRSHTWMVYVPGLYASLDLPDVAALTAPGALLVQQCSRDRLYPMPGMKGAVDKLTAIYRKAGIAERFRGTFHDVPHSFNPEMQEEAFEWIERWI